MGVSKVSVIYIYIYIYIDKWRLHIICVRAKNEVGGPALTWAHNLFVVWALDFLPWVVPNTETQQSNFSL